MHPRTTMNCSTIIGGVRVHGSVWFWHDSAFGTRMILEWVLLQNRDGTLTTPVLVLVLVTFWWELIGGEGREPDISSVLVLGFWTVKTRVEPLTLTPAMNFQNIQTLFLWFVSWTTQEASYNMFNRFVASTLKLSNVILTFGAGSRKVNSGWSGDEPHGCQSTVERRLLGLWGIVGLPVLAKLTVC